MTENVIPLAKDPALDNPTGVDPADARKSGVTITSIPGNADETVKLDADMEDVGGVEIAKELEEEYADTPPPVIPIPGASESE